ncbi:MAG: Gfo/Idh/MocA family oxidoreductase [Candidatus Nealsonbacteria bacterium]|nr:Gfo/Idh/MocA family oxidoreductase [Candidatus Nealsonbacteria bacterium]
MSSTAKKVVDRRTFVVSAAAAVTAAKTRPSGAATSGAATADSRKYRVGVIGHTGRGNYGHGMDRVWLDVPGAQIVGVADADPKGLAAAVKRLGGPKGFADYRRMLDETKPELVTICPRWLDQHRDMVVAAAERGVRGIYQEKPMSRTLAEADEMIAACEKHNVKAAMAHQTRYSQKLPVIREMIRSGRLGRILEFRARGKDDHRGGGEDLWVLGTHVLNLMTHFAGDPKTCYGTVWQDGRPIRADDVKPGPEGIGPLAGDEVHATYRFAGKVSGTFDSIRNGRGDSTRFGLRIFGSEGVLHLYETGHLPSVHFLADSSWSPGRTGKRWVAVSSAGPDKPEPLRNEGLHGGNVLAVRDLIAAVEEDRQPMSSIYEARTATEMIVAVFESQRTGGPVEFPLQNRENPLAMLK